MAVCASDRQALLANLAILLLPEAQPGYEAGVLSAIENLSALTSLSLKNISVDNFASHLLEAAEHSSLPAELKMGVVRDLGRLRWWCGLTMSDEDHARAGRLVREAVDPMLRQIHAPKFPLAIQPSRHALFVGSLVGPLHSPSRGAVDYARALLDDPAVRVVRVYHRGPLSEEMRAYVNERLGHLSHRVIFLKDEAGSHLPHAVLDGPWMNHFWCEDPMAIEIGVASLFGPTVMFTCADEPPLQYADVYWYLHEPEYISELWRRRGVPGIFVNNYVEMDCGPNNTESTISPALREEYGLPETSLVMATVGNRLSIDFDKDFLNGMAHLLRRRPEAHWTVIGALPSYMLDAITSAIGPQFSHINYCKKLRDLFSVIDVYVNPFRCGGGDSAMSAQVGGAVVITRGDMGDVRAFVPPSQRGAKTSEVFFATLERLVLDDAERQSWRSDQLLYTKQLCDQSAFTQKLSAVCELAFSRYQARHFELA